MTDLKEPGQPGTQALIERAEQTIQHTRALIEQTRKGNAAFASLAEAIDGMVTLQEPAPPSEKCP
jgi:hypothetical protein